VLLQLLLWLLQLPLDHQQAPISPFTPQEPATTKPASSSLHVFAAESIEQQQQAAPG
jgi:hypothetical protein